MNVLKFGSFSTYIASASNDGPNGELFLNVNDGETNGAGNNGFNGAEDVLNDMKSSRTLEEEYAVDEIGGTEFTEDDNAVNDKIAGTMVQQADILDTTVKNWSFGEEGALEDKIPIRLLKQEDKINETSTDGLINENLALKNAKLGKMMQETDETDRNLNIDDDSTLLDTILGRILYH